MDIRLIPEYKWLVGKLAKLSKDAHHIELGYLDNIGIGNPDKISELIYQCYRNDEYQIKFMFVNEPPFKKMGVEFYCLQEIGNVVFGDWYFFSLEQLIICN